MLEPILTKAFSLNGDKQKFENTSISLVNNLIHEGYQVIVQFYS